MNPVAILREVGFSPKLEDGTYDETQIAYKEVRVWCPGCDSFHPFRVWLNPAYPARQDGSPLPTWTWNGSLDSPSFEPSLLVYSAVHLCEGQHDLLATRCDKEFDECGHNGHSYAWLLPDGSVRRYKVHEYNEIPEGAERFTTGGPSPHPLDPAYGNCHTFLRNGVWEFLGDCAHSLRGFRPLEPLPDWYVKDEE